MQQPTAHSYKGITYTLNFVKEEDNQWHGYGHFDLAGEPIQVAGSPNADKRVAAINTLEAVRRRIAIHVA